MKEEIEETKCKIKPEGYYLSKEVLAEREKVAERRIRKLNQFIGVYLFARFGGIRVPSEIKIKWSDIQDERIIALQQKNRKEFQLLCP